VFLYNKMPTNNARSFMRFFSTIFFITLFLLPFSVTAQHIHSHGGHTHDHRDDEHDEREESSDTQPDIALDLRLMTSQQVETGHSGFLLNLELEWRKTSLTVFSGLGVAREITIFTGPTFTEGMEIEYIPVEVLSLFLGGTYHNGPFEETVASAGILEGGIQIHPAPLLDLSLSGSLSGLAIKPTSTNEEETTEEEHHHMFLLPAIHGGHPEHVEEGPPQWFISAEMRINLWRNP
jgi:hypothetical protein